MLYKFILWEMICDLPSLFSKIASCFTIFYISSKLQSKPKQTMNSEYITLIKSGKIINKKSPSQEKKKIYSPQIRQEVKKEI